MLTQLGYDEQAKQIWILSGMEDFPEVFFKRALALLDRCRRR